MEITEFEQRTGFFPSLGLYEIIEKEYMDFTGDKDAFCKVFKKNEGGMAEKIQKEADAKNFKVERQHNADLTSRDIEIQRLKAELEREQEWKPYEDTDNVSQEDYERLANTSDTKRLTDNEAKDLLYEWYGFAKEKVTIHYMVPVYEVNRHRQLRKVGKAERLPLYNATDWNYIRFDCGCMSYELKNDNLRPYMH